DSVSVILEKTRKPNAKDVATGFTTAWNSLGLEQQRKIQEQVRLMQKKKYAAASYLLQYFGAIANAINTEGLDATRFNEYLDVCQQVLDTDNKGLALKFFERSNHFFQHHALHFERTFRLRAQDDDYHFEFIARTVASWEEQPPSEDQGYDDGYDDTYEDSYDTTSYTDLWSDPVEEEPVSYDDPPSDSFQEVMPSWMTPPVQPYVEGPVIRF